MNIYFNHFIKKVDLFKFSIRHEQNGIIDVVVATEDRLLNERKDNITENVLFVIFRAENNCSCLLEFKFDRCNQMLQDIRKKKHRN